MEAPVNRLQTRMAIGFPALMPSKQVWAATTTAPVLLYMLPSLCEAQEHGSHGGKHAWVALPNDFGFRAKMMAQAKQGGASWPKAA